MDVDADLDLFVYLGSSLVGYSAAGGSTEIVDFTLGGKDRCEPPSHRVRPRLGYPGWRD